MPIPSAHRYKTLDLLRLYCACLVIFIHMGLGDSVAFIPCVTRQAVPFFFLASSFFFTKRAAKAENLKAFTISYIKPILIVYAVWALLWTPNFYIEALSNHSGKSVFYIVLIVLRRILLCGAAQYWYLLILSESVIVLAFLMHHRAYRIGWVLCLLGIALHIIYNQHFSSGVGRWIYQVFYTVFCWDCNVIMTGFPLVFLGFFFARNEEKLASHSRWLYLALFILTVAAAFIVHTRSQSLYGVPAGFLQAIFLFLFCLPPARYEDRIPGKLCRWTRNHSSVIYLTHSMLLILLGKGFQIWGWLPRVLIIVAFTAVLLVIVLKLKWKPLWKLFMVK